MGSSSRKESSTGLARKSQSSSSSLSSIARRKGSFLGSSAILPTFSFSSNAFRILANSLRLRRRRASSSSSESLRSKSAPRFRWRVPLLMSLKSLATAFSSKARSLFLLFRQHLPFGWK